MRRTLLALVAAAALLGCGDGGAELPIDARPQPDAIGADAGAGEADAAPEPPPDAAPVEPPTTALDVTSAGGRMSGPRFVLEVQIGHGLSQATMNGAERRLHGAAAVAP